MLPLYIAYVKGRNAFDCRKKRWEAVSRGRCCRGIIRHVVVESVRHRGRHGRIYYRKRYHMIIERLEEGLAAGTEIKTDAYRVPVHFYLKSREVKLYWGASGRKWYVEELQCGWFLQHPMILKADGSDEKNYAGEILSKVIWIILLLLIFVKGIL